MLWYQKQIFRCVDFRELNSMSNALFGSSSELSGQTCENERWKENNQSSVHLFRVNVQSCVSLTHNSMEMYVYIEFLAKDRAQ